METLEGKSRVWYEWLEPRSFFSLRDMHQVFYKNYKGNSPSLSWDCCDQSQDIIQYLLDIDEDFVNMHPEDLLTAIQAFHMHPSYHKNADKLDEEENSQETVKETESCCTPAQRNTRPSSPLVEEEMDQIVNRQPSSEIFYR